MCACLGIGEAFVVLGLFGGLMWCCKKVWRKVLGPFDTEEEAEEMRRCMGGMQMRPIVVKEVK